MRQLQISLAIPLNVDAVAAESTFRGMTEDEVLTDLRARVGQEIKKIVEALHGVADGIEIVVGESQ